MSPNRFTTPIVSTKVKAGEEPMVTRDPAITVYFSRGSNMLFVDRSRIAGLR